MKKILGIVLVAFFGSIVLTDYCQAIPAFARKYRLSCKTCHSPAAPSLKDYGEDFAGDGFRLEEYDAPGYYVDAGDENLSLLRSFPLAVRLDGFVTYNNGNDKKSDFGAPYLMKLLSGGAISENLSYYFYFYMSERGEVVGLEDAYLMYNNLFDTELDVKLGQFQVSDPLFTRELRLQLEDYRLYTSQIGNSRIGLKYDKGLMLEYGFDTGTDLVLEVINGNGIGEARAFHVFDQDRFKNFLGRISQNIGEHFRVGGFAYLGKEHLENNYNDAITNQVEIFGPDFTVNVDDRVEFNFQYTIRNDSEVYPVNDAFNPREDLSTNGMLAEFIYSPMGDQSDWYLLGMYNRVESDFDPADYESMTFHAGYLIRRNIRLVGEYTYVATGYNESEFGRFSLGFVSGF
ncbi:MAG: hypothetical protein K9H65_06560 [Bacteroidales bacterium]|nr:hypothetical protein [Bacteroidales bacterium]